jgi:hypothetical protein
MNKIVIDTELNDDWIRQLPGYEEDRKANEELRKKLVKNNKNVKKTKKKVLKFVKK